MVKQFGFPDKNNVYREHNVKTFLIYPKIFFGPENQLFYTIGLTTTTELLQFSYPVRRFPPEKLWLQHNSLHGISFLLFIFYQPE